MITPEYRNEILSKVLLMKEGEVRELEQTHDYPAKVEALKSIIDRGIDIKHKFQLTFNNNYTKIRRDHYHE